MKLFLSWPRVMLAVIFTFGVLIQLQTYLMCDVSWLMTVAERFLAGGTYTNDFLEINPPMSIYIHVPAVLLAHAANMSLTASARIFIIGVVLLSLFICSRLLTYIIRKESLVYNIMIVSLAFIYMILPGQDFGQREHLSVMLIMPYLLTSVIKLKNASISKNMKFLSGALAGIGFAIKPHLLFALILIEIYIFTRKKKIVDFFRLENIAIGLVFIAYITTAWFLNRDYINLVPHIMTFYSFFLHNNMNNLIDTIIFIVAKFKVIFFFSISIIYFFMRSKCQYRELADIILLAMAGFFIFAIAEPIFLNYHFLPLFAMSTLLAALVFSEIEISSPIDNSVSSTRLMSSYIFTVFLALFIFTLPIYLIYLDTKIAFKIKNEYFLNRFINLVEQSKQSGPIYFFSTSCDHSIYLHESRKSTPTSKYECMWPAFNVFSQRKSGNTRKLENEKSFFIRSVIDDLKRHPPYFIFVDYRLGWGYSSTKFDYLALFSTSPEFKEIWKKYKLIATFAEIAVYSRTAVETESIS